MKFVTAAVLALALMAPAACDRPDQGDCEEAVDKVRTLYGTSDDKTGASRAAAIRSCRGNADRESIQCILDADTKEELIACEGDVAQDLFGTGGEKEGGGDQEDGDQPADE